MHTRELGAAHVNIFFPLILFVLLIGAGGFAYIQYTENNELRDRAQKAESSRTDLVNDIAIRDDYIKEVTALVGEAGEYVGKGKDAYGKAQPLANVTVPAKLQSLAQDFAKKSNVPETQISPFATLFGQVTTQLGSKDSAIADLTAQATKMQAQVDQAAASLSEANSSHSSAVTRLTTEKTELRQYVDQEFNKRDQTISALQQNLASRRQEMEQLKDEHATAVLAITKERDLTKAHADAMAQKIKLINPPQEPDGAVISSSQAAGKAWVNLGRKDLLPRGTVFAISAPNGTLKAHGTVTRVEYDRAEVAISGLVDRFDPVVKGDLVRNDLYSPNVKRNIFLMGRFSYPHTKPAVKLILENLGNKVHDTISPAVDLVIVGGDTLNDEGSGFTPIGETQEYKDALFYGIEMAPLNKVRDFIKLDTGTAIGKK